jgi:hypothetical protein
LTQCAQGSECRPNNLPTQIYYLRTPGHHSNVVAARRSLATMFLRLRLMTAGAAEVPGCWRRAPTTGGPSTRKPGAAVGADGSGRSRPCRSTWRRRHRGPAPRRTAGRAASPSHAGPRTGRTDRYADPPRRRTADHRRAGRLRCADMQHLIGWGPGGIVQLGAAVRGMLRPLRLV